jgi:hypothetical protein
LMSDRMLYRFAQAAIGIALIVTIIGYASIANAYRPCVRQDAVCSVTEREWYDWSDIVRVASQECQNARYTPSAAWLTSFLVIEAALGVPPQYRGMSLAAACHESGFNPAPDPGDDGYAVGMFQMWPIWERDGMDREDPHSSAMAWVGRIVELSKGRAKKCDKPFLAAWSWVARGPRDYRCSTTGHMKVLKRWHRLIRGNDGYCY